MVAFWLSNFWENYRNQQSAFSKKPKSAVTFHQGQEEHGLPQVTQPLKMIF
jgi:hypothetical protein